MFVKIKDYPDYQINEYGEVKSIYVTKLLKPRNAGRGYQCYQLRNEHGKKNKYIHRLVAEAFIPNPDNLPQVDHIDGNKKNNHVSNLRWVDNRTNMISYGHDTRDQKSYDAVHVKIMAISENQTLYFDSQSELLKFFNYCRPTSRLKFNEKYNYGKLKDFTLYRI